MEKYNGWKNRSTWLVTLHLDNTSKEVYDEAVSIAVNSDTTKQFMGRIQTLIQHNNMPLLWKEEEFDAKEIDYGEVWDAFRFTE